jgi:hypothetical protein
MNINTRVYKTLLIAIIFFAEADTILLIDLTPTTDSNETTSQDKLDLQARIYLLSDKDTMELGLCES